MDPLSITASAITIATLAAQTCSVFLELRSLCKSLPGRLHAANNEVADIELVLFQVASAFKERATSIPEEHQQAIPTLLHQAEAKLGELKAAIEQLSNICKQSRIFPAQAYAWRKERPKIKELQEDIHAIKCSLNVALGASNSYLSPTFDTGHS